MKILSDNSLRITVIEDDGRHPYLAAIDIERDWIQRIMWNQEANEVKFFVKIKFPSNITPNVYLISEEEYLELGNILLKNQKPLMNFKSSPPQLEPVSIRKIINPIMELQV